MVHLAKLIVASRATQYATANTKNDFQTLKRLGRWYLAAYFGAQPLEWCDVTWELAKAFLDHGLRRSSIRGNDFARVRDMYRYGV